MINYLKKLRLRTLILLAIEIVLIFVGFYVVGDYEMNGWIIALILLLFFTLNVLYTIVLFHLVDRKTRNNYLTVGQLLGFDIKQTYDFGQLGIIIYDDNKEIIWTNETLETRNINIIGLNLFEWKSDFEKAFNDDNLILYVSISDRIYQCKHLSELKVIILQDVTELETLKHVYSAEAPVYMNIIIDNYADVALLMEEDEVLNMDAKVRTAISDWADEYGLLIKRYRNESYLCICQEQQYQELLKDKFSVLDDVRKAGEDSDNSFTLSIGIARNERNLVTLSEMANSALDVALSRGGDQVVINSAGQNMEFYGGKTEAKAQRHRVKLKVMSKSLMTLFDSCKKVLVMGHRDADFDAIGACVAVYAMVESLNKKVKIVYDDKLVETKTKLAFKQLYDKQTIEKMIISPAKALDEVDDDTIVVLVDANKKAIAMAPNVLSKSTKIVVIDHHIGVEKIDCQIFSYQEASASSTCEILAEMIKYNDRKIIISPETATMMLTGILLDTNNYRVRTGARTYDASIILKEFNADHNQALEFLKDEYEEFILKNRIMANSSTPYYGVIVSKASEEDIIDKATLAKVAQEALFIKGIKTIFVIGRISEDQIGVSARSDGSNNVGLIMEKMGGGGHFSAAATQKDGASIDEVEQELNEVLEVYIGDSRIEQ